MRTSTTLGDCFGHALFELPAIRQIGQRIDPRQDRQFLLDFLQVRHVGTDGVEAIDTAVGQLVRDINRLQDAFDANRLGGHFETHGLAAKRPLEVRQPLAVRLLADELLNRHADQRAGCDAEPVLEGRIPEPEPVRRIDICNQGRNVVGKKAQPLFALRALQFVAAAFGDIECQRIKAADLTLRIKFRNVIRLEMTCAFPRCNDTLECDLLTGETGFDVGRKRCVKSLAANRPHGAADQRLGRYAEHPFDIGIDECVAFAQIDMRYQRRQIIGNRLQPLFAAFALAFGFLPVADVSDEGIGDESRAIVKAGRRYFDRNPGAVAAHRHDLALGVDGRTVAGALELGHVGNMRRGLFGRHDQVRQQLACRFLCRPMKEGFRTGVPVGYPAIAVHGNECIVGAGQDRLVTRLFIHQPRQQRPDLQPGNQGAEPHQNHDHGNQLQDVSTDRCVEAVGIDFQHQSKAKIADRRIGDHGRHAAQILDARNLCDIQFGRHERQVDRAICFVEWNRAWLRVETARRAKDVRRRAAADQHFSRGAALFDFRDLVPETGQRLLHHDLADEAVIDDDHVFRMQIKAVAPEQRGNLLAGIQRHAHGAVRCQRLPGLGNDQAIRVQESDIAHTGRQQTLADFAQQCTRLCICRVERKGCVGVNYARPVLGGLRKPQPRFKCGSDRSAVGHGGIEQILRAGIVDPCFHDRKPRNPGADGNQRQDAGGAPGNPAFEGVDTLVFPVQQILHLEPQADAEDEQASCGRRQHAVEAGELVERGQLQKVSGQGGHRNQHHPG